MHHALVLGNDIECLLSCNEDYAINEHHLHAHRYLCRMIDGECSFLRHGHITYILWNATFSTKHTMRQYPGNLWMALLLLRM